MLNLSKWEIRGVRQLTMDLGIRKALCGLLNLRNKFTLKTSSMTEFFIPLLRLGDRSGPCSTLPKSKRLPGKKTFWLGLKNRSKALVPNMKQSNFTMMLNKISHSNAPSLTKDCSQKTVASKMSIGLKNIMLNYPVIWNRPLGVTVELLSLRISNQVHTISLLVKLIIKVFQVNKEKNSFIPWLVILRKKKCGNSMNINEQGRETNEKRFLINLKSYLNNDD